MEEMMMKVPRCDLSETKETNEKRGSTIKIEHLFSFVLSLSSRSWLPSFGVLQELCTDLERELKDFKCAIHNDIACVKSFEIQPSIVSFVDCWRPVGVRFSKLRQFCCDIATVIPGTSTMESHFNVINWEYGEVRGSLTEFSLEGILHCNQFKRLQDMKHSSALHTLDILSYPFPANAAKNRAIPYFS
jgi:hypothetical protein